MAKPDLVAPGVAFAIKPRPFDRLVPPRPRRKAQGVRISVVVPSPDYVRFATHYRFRPDFCHAADPESKGIVENLVGYAKDDLLVPLEFDDDPWAEATRGQGERSGSAQRDREPSAGRQRENLTFALATRAVEALEDLALNVAAIRQRLERLDSPASGERSETNKQTPGGADATGQ